MTAITASGDLLTDPVILQAGAMSFSGHTARKRFGQHWLRDERVLDHILEASGLQADDRVLEVGPGRGALTERLLRSPAAAVHAVELDRDLVAGLRERFGSDARFSLREGDVLDVPLTLPDEGLATKVVANIPYNITGPLMERLIGRLDRPVDPPYQRLVLLVQKEVAERIERDLATAAFGLSVRMQLLAQCTTVCPSRPAVSASTEGAVGSDSTGSPAYGAAPRACFGPARRAQQAFLARRKMLRNTLAGLCPPEHLQALAAAAGIDLQQRPQEVAPSAWVELARGLNQADSAA